MKKEVAKKWHVLPAVIVLFCVMFTGTGHGQLVMNAPAEVNGIPVECFIDIGLDKWGWTMGPLEEGFYSFLMYAGAGQCILDNGTLVGNVYLDYGGGIATVRYVAAGDEFREVHLWVGSTPLPLVDGVPTAAPGQFPYHDSAMDPDGVITITGLSGPIHIAAHAVVDGETAWGYPGCPICPEDAAYCLGDAPLALSEGCVSEPAYTPDVEGDYVITCTDENGCICVYTITIYPLPECPEDAGYCLDDPAIPQTLPETDVSVPEYNPNIPDTYNITRTDDNGCQCTYTIIIHSLPECPEDAAYCLDDPAIPPELPETDVSVPPYDPTTDDTYNITRTDENGCQCTYMIVIHPLPVCDYPDMVVCVGDTSVQIPEGCEGAYDPNTPGTYAVSCTVVDPLTGCENECGYTITVEYCSCETAWAYGGDAATCFLNVPGLVTENWGWTNGPLEAGAYVFDLYTGAGLCDLSKGVLVGTVTVAYDGSIADVTYAVSDGYALQEAHLWVGDTLLPMRRGEFLTAPGQLGNNSGDITGTATFTFTVNKLRGPIYVAAHAVVCEGNATKTEVVEAVESAGCCGADKRLSIPETIIRSLGDLLLAGMTLVALAALSRAHKRP